MWKLGRALQAFGDPDTELEAQGLIDQADQIYWDMSGTRTDGSTAGDWIWDGRILPWYR